MKPPDDPEADPAPARPPPCALDQTLIAAAPDVTSADEHRWRKDLVRQRLFGGGPPTVRIGRFTLLGLVGSGAMSVVYAAYDEKLDRRVALKLLRAPLALGDERLRREAQAMARLAHPNVVAVHDFGDWEGRLFLAMELVKGPTLDAWLTAHRRTWKEIVEVFLQAGRGLAAAHEHNLVHRDFKPVNVIVGEDGRTRVLDFGLVRVAEQAGAPAAAPGAAARRGTAPARPGTLALTEAGACPGTPAYMGPEQRAGGAADARSDQFSFCVALHEALFGARPGAAPAAGHARCEGPIPLQLARVLERGLREDPAARWPSMGHLLAALERLRWPARRWRLRAVLLGTAALVAAVTLLARHRVVGLQHARAALERAAAHERVLADDARLVTAAQRLIERDPTAAAAALREVRFADKARGWRSMATAVLLEPLSRTVTRGLDTRSIRAALSGDGRHVLAPISGGDVLVWPADGSKAPGRLPAEPGSTSVASADGAWVLSWRRGGAAAVLTRIDGGERRTLGEPDEGVAGAAFHGTGTDVVTVSPLGVVRLWRSGRSHVLRTLPRELATREPARWTFHLGPAGRRVHGTAPSGERWQWPADGTRPPVQLETGGRRIHNIWYSRDERWIAMGFEGGELEVRDLDAGGPPRVLRGHAKLISDLDFSPDGRRLATASRDGTAHVWRLDGAGEPLVLRGHTAPVSGIRFDPDGRRVVTTSRDRTARVWSLDASGDVMVLRGHTHHVGSASFSADGRTVLTYGLEPAVRLWDVSRRPVHILGRHEAEIWSASLAPDGRQLATAAADGTARIWSLDGAGDAPIVLRGHEHRELYRAVFSPDGRRVATGAADGTARIWSLDGTAAPIVLGGHHRWVYGLAFSPDGRWLATGAMDGEIRVSPADGPGEARILERGSGHGYAARVHDLIFGPRGDRLAANAAGADGTTALLWIGGERRDPLGTPRNGKVTLAMSRDGRIATGEKDGSIQLWSEGGAGPLAILRGHGAEIHALAFSRDGQRLLSASMDGSARLWELGRPGPPVLLRGHEDWVLDAAFDAAERRVVTASSDRTARVWDLAEPEQPIVLRGHEGDVRYAGFTPEGRVVTASTDGTVRLWSLGEVTADAPTLLELLRRATTVCLTAYQRMQYLDEPAATAATRFAACERAMGRAAPTPPAASGPPPWPALVRADEG